MFRFKISKRVKDRLPMVAPGTRDNDILPSSGSSMSSGLSLDYSALNIGGIDNGVPYNHADDGPKKIKVRKAPDFSETGIWLVETPQGIKRMYSDIYSTRWWYEDTGELEKHYGETFLGFNKQEAIEKLQKKYPKVEIENEVDDDNTKGNGAFVGGKEEGFAFRHNLDYGSTANLKAVVITGNPKFTEGNKTAEKFYREIKNYLQQKGYTVYFQSPNDPCTPPRQAHLLVGHSNGLYKLNSYMENGKLLAFGAIPEKATNNKIVFANHPVDEEYLKKCHYNRRYDYPIPEHFVFTDGMKAAIDRATEAIVKEAFPDWPQYSDPQMYQQVMERPDANVTPAFNIFETYYADDGKYGFKLKKLGPGVYTTEDGRFDLFKFDEGPWRGWWLYRSTTDKYDVIDPVRTMKEALESLNARYADEVEAAEDADEIEVIDEVFNKKAFVKTALTYDSNSVIQELIKIPQVKSCIEQQAAGYVDKIIVTTPSADIQQTQQQLKTQPPGLPPVELQPISGDPYGHVWISEDPKSHQKKPLDRIVRIDKVSDQWGTLVTILHEITHHRHPDWSEAQVESEAENLAGTVKQFLTGGAHDHVSGKTNIIFVKQSLHSMPMVQCDLADTYQKQVIGLQNHSSLRPQHGLLFTYASQQPLTFWMGKVPFAIDIIFANKNNEIVKIYRNCQPNSTDLFTCEGASKVIEVVGSFCAFHDINVGDHVFYADDREESLTQHILEKVKDIKLEQQKDLGMTDWSIKIVMKKTPDSRRFMKVNWTPEDYKMKKADIVINPNPTLIEGALKEMPLDKLVRHALLHILAGAKNELPEDKEQKLITDKLY